MRPVTDFLRGARIYWQGARSWTSDPALMALGLIPGLITAWLFVASFVAMVLWLGSLSDWIATLLVGDGGAHALVQMAAALGVVGSTILVVVYGFVAVTSVIGQPFFERLSCRVDDRLGPVTMGPEWPWWLNAARGVGEGLRLALVAIPASLALFLLGLIPLVGTVIAWTLGALIGGWFVALEFTAVPFERRGLRLPDRRRILARRRAQTIGFGAMAFVMSAFAPVAVLMMPSAVAGGTLLARAALDEEELIALATSTGDHEVGAADEAARDGSG
jgi:CysZ protein